MNDEKAAEIDKRWKKMMAEKQKADKGIEKIEKEEKQLARVMRIWKALTRQRPKRGNWK